MELTIDIMCLSLPAGFETRAANIARLTVEVLARGTSDQPVSIERLRLPKLTFSPFVSDGEIATSIANTILQQLRGAGATL